ncbi:MAG: TonB-dependent receptor, partial [Ignavibacteriales bacterium]|nr:TonB-dependent receptor [Ignavibacteriales bacterium]
KYAGTVAGSVVDDASRKPIEFVNTTVRNSKDSSILTGTVTDIKGKFEVTDLPAGDYYIKFSMLGYKEKKSVPFKIDAQHRKANLGTIGLTETAVAMNEVVIGAEKTTFTTAIDRKVYNVEQDIVSKAGSASDLLQNIPSVEVDIDGNVSLRGSGNVLILINGKTSALMARSSATVLQQMPANSIERIEVITNPSAKYKPDGTSGILNIVLKKNTGLGINGSSGITAGIGDRYGANARLNYNPGDLNLHASYSIRKDGRNRTTSDARLQFDSASVPTHYRSDLRSTARPLAHMAQAGLDYQLDDENTVSASGNYFYNSQDRHDISNLMLTDALFEPQTDNTRLRLNTETEKELGSTLSYEHAFPGEDHTLQSEYKYEKTAEIEDNRYSNIYRKPFAPMQYDNTLVKQDETKNEVTIAYANPLSADSKFEAGYVGEFCTRRQENDADSLNTSLQRIVVDTTKTNLFDYNDAIHAMYATYKHSFGQFGFLAGLRMEYSTLRSHLVTLDSTIENSYFNLFPTLHLSYKLNEEVEMQLNYSRRTRRPEGDDLNPFPEYRDARNMSSGNPKLLPEYTHSIEAGCKFENEGFSLLPSIYYRYTYNRWTSVTRAISDTLLLTTMTNLSKDQSTGIEAILSTSINGLLTAHASANVFYNQIDASNLGYGSNKSVVTWTGALTCNLNLFRSSMLQINSNYSSERLTPQGKVMPSYVVNLGYRQEFFDRRLAAIMTIADIFRTQRRENHLDTPELNQVTVNLRDSRIIMFSLSYYFGTQTKHKDDDQLKYDDAMQ